MVWMRLCNIDIHVVKPRKLEHPRGLSVCSNLPESPYVHCLHVGFRLTIVVC